MKIVKRMRKKCKGEEWRQRKTETRKAKKYKTNERKE